VIDRPVAEAIPGWAAVSARIPIAAEGTTNPRAESLPLALGHRELWLSIVGVDVVDGVVYAFRDLTEERALDEMKTEFVSTVSHELRTPLAAIYGAAMTLRREDVALGEEQREGLLSVIANEADRLARTVNDILYASRIDTDTLKVAIESCDAGRARDRRGRGPARAPPAGHRRAAHRRGGACAGRGRPRQGAAGAREPRRERREVLTRRRRVQVELTGVGAQVRFSVADEGLGIPHAEQRRIFEKFYRLDPNMTRGIGGTGLGLYICRELVRRMHGRIWVESETGRGSTFTFELPIAGTDAEVTAHARIAF
jgi:signal transduction histidine kinase